MSRTRDWHFVINNWTSEDEARLLRVKESAVYMVVGKELAPTTGTPHLQGYVYFASARSCSSARKALSPQYTVPAVGTAAQNHVYCTKDKDVFIEHGVMPTQGKRTDIDQVRDRLREGANMATIVSTAKSLQSIKIAEVYLSYHEEQRDWKPEVRWYHGPTGSGKTRAAREWLGEDIYTAGKSIQWWQGYDKHENVLMDDFRKDFCKFHELLRLLDRYPFRIEYKGGARQFLARKIAITSPMPPSDIFQLREDVGQLLRRIDEVIFLDYGTTN